MPSRARDSITFTLFLSLKNPMLPSLHRTTCSNRAKTLAVFLTASSYP